MATKIRVLRLMLIILIIVIILSQPKKRSIKYDYDYDYDADFKYEENANKNTNKVDQTTAQSAKTLKDLEDQYLKSIKPQESPPTEKTVSVNLTKEEKRVADSINMDYAKFEKLKTENADSILHHPENVMNIGVDPRQREAFKNRRLDSHMSETKNFEKVYTNNFNEENNTKSSGYNFLGIIYEGLAFMFLAGLVYRCIHGKEDYDKHLTNWYKLNKDFLQERFNKELHYYHTQKDNQENKPELLTKEDEVPKDAVAILRESSSVYSYYAEEGDNIHSITIKFDIKKTQDSFFILNNILFSSKDRIYFELVLDNTEETPCPNLFMFCKQKDAPRIIDSNVDMKALCCNSQYMKSFDKMVFSENQDLIEFIFNKEDLKNKFILLKNGIEMIIHSEDQKKSKKLIVIFELDIYNITKEERTFSEITKFTILLADAITQYIPKAELKEELIEKRERYINGGKTNKEIEEERVKENIIETSQTQNTQNSKILQNETKKVNVNKTNDIKKKKVKAANWNDEGIYAFTNSRCSELRPKTLFFK